MDKEDEEFSVDLSKVTDFFKKKLEKKEVKEERAEEAAAGNKEASEKEPEETEEKKEEIKIDLKSLGQQLKNLVKGGVEFEQADFLKKHQNKLLILVPLVIVLFLCVQVRMIPADAPYTKIWAEQSVHQTIQNDITNTINQQYPNLPQQNKNELISNEFTTALNSGSYFIRTGQYAGQTINIKEQIKATKAYFRTFYEYDSGPEQGKLYAPDIDPYYWYRYAENIIKHGHPGDELRDIPGDNSNVLLPWDNHQVAPNGRVIVQADRFHPYFLAYFYKALHIFNPSLTLLRSTLYYPIFISALTVLFIFFIARRIAGNIAGLFAAVAAAINTAFVNRTLFGHADSDSWVIFFPVLITFFLLESFYSKKPIKQIILAAAAGLFTGIFGLAWGGWWYIFDFLIGALVSCLVFYVAVNFRELKHNFKEYLKNPQIKNVLRAGIPYYFSSGIFITLFVNLREFLNAPFAFMSFTTVKTPVLLTFWPNVLTTVAEFNEGSIDQIINAVGGTFLFWIAALGLLLMITKKNLRDLMLLGLAAIWWAVVIVFMRTSSTLMFVFLLALPVMFKLGLSILQQDKKLEVKHTILLMVWLAGTIYASTKGIRFSLLIVPAFSVAIGAAFGITYKFITKWATKELQINKAIISIVLIILLFLPFATPYNQAKTQARYDVPIISDAWYNSLTEIKEKSEEDAIITSWWDFGHHFKAIADRAVTFDGTTQVTPQAHWVGKILSTSDEEQAIGILRMLDCGGNNAFDKLYEINNDTHKSVNALYDIFKIDKTKAKRKLTQEYDLTNEQAEKILQYTHCEAPEAYFITSQDMIGKAGVWAHFGLWDFEKAAILKQTKNMKEQEAVSYMQQKFDYSEEMAKNYYYEIQSLTTDREENTWVSPWPGYLSGFTDCSEEAEEINCPQVIQTGSGNAQVNIKVNLKTLNAYIPEANNIPPTKIVYATKEGIFEKTFEGATSGFGLMILPKSDGGYMSLVSSPELTGSMFSKLFFYEGHGSKYFKPFTEKMSLTGQKIYVWKIDWEGKEENKVFFTEKTTAQQGDEVTVGYIGYLDNGKVFDSNIKDWQQKNITKETGFEGEEYIPLTFTIGKYEMIAGFERGIKNMKINQTKTFRITPDEGYGDIKGHPLANENLNFKIKLLSIK